MRTCPGCFAPMTKDATTCPSCGRSLLAPDQASSKKGASIKACLIFLTIAVLIWTGGYLMGGRYISAHRAAGRVRAGMSKAMVHLVLAREPVHTSSKGIMAGLIDRQGESSVEYFDIHDDTLAVDFNERGEVQSVQVHDQSWSTLRDVAESYDNGRPPF